MFKRVLVPLDGSKLAECALPYARDLAKNGVAEELVLVNVIPLLGPMMSGRGKTLAAFMEENRESSRAYLARVQEQLASEGVSADIDVLEGNPALAIVDWAAAEGVDLILIGTHGYTGVKQLLLGSVASGVAKQAHCPVLLIRPDSCATEAAE
jgi:nucleotide-binding universal stress UspA family protein